MKVVAVVLLLAGISSIARPGRLFAAAAPACKDVQPGEFPCAMEKIWGKCGENWMQDGNFCAASCGRCKTDKETPPSQGDEPTAAEEGEESSAVPAEGEESDVPAPLVDGQIIQVPIQDSFKGFDVDCDSVIDTLKRIPGTSIAAEIFQGIKDTDEEFYDLLDGKETQFTVFVPLDSALEPYVDPLKDPDVALQVVQDHVANLVLPSRLMKKNAEIDTMRGNTIVVEASTAEGISLSQSGVLANVVLSDAWACHSIIHLIDDVLSA